MILCKNEPAGIAFKKAKFFSAYEVILAFQMEGYI
jgi:hypothetical protein